MQKRQGRSQVTGALDHALLTSPCIPEASHPPPPAPSSGLDWSDCWIASLRPCRETRHPSIHMQSPPGDRLGNAPKCPYLVDNPVKRPR